MTHTTQDTAEEILLDIEGTDGVPWHEDTITTEKIAELGGWDSTQGVVEVDPENNERPLKPGETVKVRHGHGFGKKHRWKRG